MKTYRRKGTIKALQWTGGNLDEMKEFLGDCFISEGGGWITYVKSPLRQEPNPQVVGVGSYFTEGWAGSTWLKYTLDTYDFEREWE